MRRLLGLLALFSVAGLPVLPVGGTTGHCAGHHQSPADHHGEHGGRPHAAPPECPHCPAASCATVTPCSTGLAALPGAGQRLSPAISSPPALLLTASFTTRDTKPGLPPPRPLQG